MRTQIIVIILFVFNPLINHAQFCTGTLGDNIFLEGDFGSGGPNLLSPNPNIAPGYTYTFNVPPFDGQYVITNNTGSWPGLFPTWLGIGDNSLDPNGYMMVVNASNAPGLFYQQTVTGLCENTLYEFSADIINLIQFGTPNHIDPDVSFLINGVSLFTTGNIPETNNWSTYGFTFTTNIGQQDLTLSLRNNAPGGNGNDLALDNISFRACGPITSINPDTNPINLCEDDAIQSMEAIMTGDEYVNPSIQWQQSQNNGFTWTNIAGATQTNFTTSLLPIGVHYFRFIAADGASNLLSENCRVNSDIKVINVYPKAFPQTETICNGLSYSIGNSVYTATGIYQDTFINFLGCDSIIITDLTVMTDPTFVAEFTTTMSCSNLANGSITIDNVQGVNPPFIYYFDGVDLGTTNEYTNLFGGASYTVAIQDNNGCIIDTTIFLDTPSELLLSLGEDIIVELGESVQIVPFSNFDPEVYTWHSLTPNECIDLNDCTVLNFVPTTDQFVSLELFTVEGCSVTDSLFISVTDARKIFIPNVFTPNGDGENDFFTIFGVYPNVVMIESLQVFDRWGGMVFENKNFLPNSELSGWDGRSNGHQINVGNYIYTTTIRFVDNQVLRYSGDVTLLR